MYFKLFCTFPIVSLCVYSKNFYKTLSLCSSEFNNSFLDSVGSDEDSGNEDVLDMEYTEAEAEELKRNAEVGDVILYSLCRSSCQYYSCCSLSSKAPLSVSIAGPLLPLWQPSNGLHFLLAFAPHFLHRRFKTKWKKQKNPHILITLCAC